MDSGNLQSKSFSVVLFHLFIYFSIYLVILKSPTSGAAACHAGIAAVPFCFLSKKWSLWEGTEWEGRGEIFGRELPGGILVDATLEQSRSLHATILHQDCTLSKVHSSVITPLKKKRLEKEAVGAWNRKGDDGVKILSEQTLAGSAFLELSVSLSPERAGELGPGPCPAALPASPWALLPQFPMWHKDSPFAAG